MYVTLTCGCMATRYASLSRRRPCCASPPLLHYYSVIRCIIVLGCIHYNVYGYLYAQNVVAHTLIRNTCYDIHYPSYIILTFIIYHIYRIYYILHITYISYYLYFHIIYINISYIIYPHNTHIIIYIQLP